jgi:hypothetical protein
VTDLDDDGHAISFQVLRRGTPVRSADGVELGKVRRVHEAKREHIFDGIDVDTPDGLRFLDAPEVARIAERRVTLTITAEEARELPEHRGRLGAMEAELRRTGRRWRKRFGR